MRYSIDFNIIERENHPQIVPEEFLHTFLPPGMPPYDLNLKIGAVYMLLRNMCVKEGLCNGTRFTLIDIDGHILQCKMIQDDRTKPEKIFRLPRITTTPPQHYPFPFKRRQYPIRTCFAMTINKSQGGTFDVEGLDASSPVFSHGPISRGGALAQRRGFGTCGWKGAGTPDRRPTCSWDPPSRRHGPP